MPSNVLQITPFMHVPDIDAAIAFFTDILGFTCPYRIADYGYVELEGAGLRILQNHGEDGAPPGNRRCSYYIDVRDVDATYLALKSKLGTLPAGDVFGPVDQHYHQRELMVLAPDGNLIVFGQAIAPGKDIAQPD
jgi:catechol 2,3-dioxygenase-like lactoylglutathione lyase family enzyme